MKWQRIWDLTVVVSPARCQPYPESARGTGTDLDEHQPGADLIYPQAFPSDNNHGHIGRLVLVTWPSPFQLVIIQNDIHDSS